MAQKAPHIADLDRVIAANEAAWDRLIAKYIEITDPVLQKLISLLK